MVDGLMADCDNIDVLHNVLEDKCAKLRKELKERPIAGDTEVMAFVDRLSDAVDKREDVDLWSVGYTALPLDADGVPIHVGDKVMDWDTPRLVVAVSEDSICLAGYESDSYYRMGIAKNYHHEPTVEDVLREFVTEFNRDDTELCDDEIIERFAKRLQLAKGDAE